MINMLRKSLSMEIDNFVSYLQRAAFNQKSFTKSAFVQSRKKISPQVFKYLSDALIDEFYTDNDLSVKLWKGFRLLAVDGSRMTLPITDELKAMYGTSNNQNDADVVQGRCSILYDVENKHVLDGILAPLEQGERALALAHLEYCRSGDLVIYDRGYPAYSFIHAHMERGLECLIRVKTNFSQVTLDFASSGKPSQAVDIYPGKNTKISDKAYERDTPMKVRLIRVELPKGDVEILMTTLLDTKVYPNSIFKKLYAKRWGVETFYDELKNKLKVEHFSGYSSHSIQQDFHAALFISNVQTLIVSDLEEEIAEGNKNRRLEYKVNNNLSYGLLKNRVLELFLEEESMEKAVMELKTLFKKHLIPIRPNRSFGRESGKYRSRMKPKITKNQKDTI
jgi:hypothetical protein